MNPNEQKGPQENSPSEQGMDTSTSGGTNDSGTDLQASFLSGKEPNSFKEIQNKIYGKLFSDPENEICPFTTEELATSTLQAGISYEEAIAEGCSHDRALLAGAISQIGYLISIERTGYISGQLQREVFENWEIDKEAKEAAARLGKSAPQKGETK